MKKGLLFIGILLIAFTVGAATGTKITAELRNQSINYNGNLSGQQVISYKGTTYVPLKAFSSLVGVSVNYKDGIVYLGEDSSTNISYWGKDIKHMAQGRFVSAEYEHNGKKHKDNTGNEYTDYLIFSSGLGEGNVDFPLNGKYKTFEAILAVPEGYERSDDGELKIYVDEKNVYNKHYSSTDMPEHIKIDITGAQKISFTMDAKTTIGAPVGLFNGEFIK